jgi:DNA-binding transcriptional regulator YdaS (Cro superfamily)
VGKRLRNEPVSAVSREVVASALAVAPLLSVSPAPLEQRPRDRPHHPARGGVAERSSR